MRAYSGSEALDFIEPLDYPARSRYSIPSVARAFCPRVFMHEAGCYGLTRTRERIVMVFALLSCLPDSGCAFLLDADCIHSSLYAIASDSQLVPAAKQQQPSKPSQGTSSNQSSSRVSANLCSRAAGTRSRACWRTWASGGRMIYGCVLYSFACRSLH